MVAGETATCWIGDKDSTIERPAGPLGDLADYGNAVELGADGARWSCYNNFRWDLTAEPLAYGNSVTVGAFSCASERTGVTCTDGTGRGFALARAQAVLS